MVASVDGGWMLTHDPSNIRVIVELVLREVCVPKWVTANVMRTLREEQKPKKQHSAFLM